MASQYMDKILPEWFLEYIAEQFHLSKDTTKIAVYTTTAASAVYILWKMMGSNKYKLPPGPRPYPVVGNLLQLEDGKMITTFDNLKKKYGDIFTFHLGPIPMVSLNTPELVKEVFMRQGNKTANRPYMRSFYEFSNGGKDIVCANMSPRVIIQRKLAHAALRQFSGGEALEAYLQSAFDNLTEHIDSTGSLLPYESAFLLAYNILASMSIGKKFKFDDPFLQDMMKLTKDAEETFASFDITEFYESLRFINTRNSKLSKVFVDRFCGYLNKAWEDHKSSYDPGNLTDFTYHLINAAKEAEDNPDDRKAINSLTEEHFVMILFDLFSAGTDTTRMTLNWIWCYLAAFPELQKRAQQEVDQVLGKEKVTNKCREQLPYVDAFIHEVMRIRPVAPSGLFHQTTEDIKAGGYDIPKGYGLVCNTWSIHMDPVNWKDPEAFIPERWLNEEGKYVFQQNGFLPFSVGKRSCVGEGFAKHELHMLTTMMLQSYTLEGEEGYQISLENAGGDVVKPKDQKLIAKKRI